MAMTPPTYPSHQDEVFSKHWRVGQQYHVHFVGVVASMKLPDGIYTLASVSGFSATFVGCDFVFGSGHFRLYQADWKELEIQRQERYDRAPVFIPLSTLRMRSGAQIAQ